MRCSIGSAKAAVLPVPVAACAEQVAAGEQERNRLALDGRRLLVAERGDGGDDGLVESERGKSGGGRLGGCAVGHCSSHSTAPEGWWHEQPGSAPRGCPPPESLTLLLTSARRLAHHHH